MKREAFTDINKYWVFRSSLRPGKWVWFSAGTTADRHYADSHAEAIAAVNNHMHEYPYLNGQRW